MRLCRLIETLLSALVSYCFSPFSRADIALIGLAVMGQNLILNMNDHGFVVSIRITISVMLCCCSLKRRNLCSKSRIDIGSTCAVSG